MSTFAHQSNDGETKVSTISKNTTSHERTRCGFFFYHSWLDDIDELPIDVQREVVFAVAQYAASRVLPTELSAAASVAFKFCKRIIDYDQERREEAEKRYRGAATTKTKIATQTPDPHSLRPQPPTPHAEAPANTPQPTDVQPLPQCTDLPFNNLESRVENPKSENTLEKKKEKTSFSQTSGDKSHPVSREQLEAYWQAEGLKSSVQEFFDYYQSTGWKNKQGERLRSWRLAAKNWERYFLTNVLPHRQKAAATQHATELCAQHAQVAHQERERRRQEHTATFDQWQRRAVSHEEGMRAYQLALQKTNGDAQAAIELLKKGG